MSRDPALLTPPLRALLDLHLDAAREIGLDPIVTYTKRTFAEQQALFAQGRSPLADVNALRATAGLPPITAKANQKVVSWTQKSKHLPGPDGLAEAYDLALRQPSGISWDPHQDGNHNFEPDWNELAKVAEGLSLPTGERLQAGLRFGDACHFQLKRPKTT